MSADIMTTDNVAGLRARLREIVASELRLPLARMSETASLADIGLDSLAFTELILSVEAKLGTGIDPAVVARRASPDLSLGELLDVLIEAM